MPFDPNKYISQKDPAPEKKAFNPAAYAAAETGAPKGGVGRGAIADSGQAFIEGIGQTGTLGYLPQMQAGASYLADKLAGAGGSVKDPRTGEEIKDNTPEESYVSRRDANISRQKQQGEDHAIASNLGKAVGLAPLIALGPAAGTIRGGAAIGALEGLASNPGDKEGVVDWAQPVDRGYNTLAGGVFGGLGGALPELAKGGKRARQMLRDMRDPEALQKTLSGKFSTAVDDLNKNYIAPRASKRGELLADTSVQINPDVLDRAGLSTLAKAMRKNSVADAGGTVRREVSGNKALKIRQLLDDVAGYHAQSPLDPVASAINKKAKASADVVRGKLSSVAPDIDPINAEMAEAFRLRKAVQDRAEKPLTSLSAKELSDKGAELARFDKLAGSDLGDTAKALRTAKSVELSPKHLVPSIHSPEHLYKLGKRLAIEASPAGEAISSASPATLQALLDAARLRESDR